ncbi:MAG: TIGR03862 family flavoprotein [Verrucomicrobiae bacterium]|nr:TIGR03862 family flavoprotein [Verrucomicrobiae bacterium]
MRKKHSAHDAREIAIVGGGPAGLRAAEVAAAGGATVTVYDAMPSVGRKFLVAGKSGLNLTNAEPLSPFLDRYTTPGLAAADWRLLVERFDNRALRDWAADLGFSTRESAGGKVFPEPMKAAPLLRAWVRRLRELGVHFALRRQLTAIGDGPELTFWTAESFEIVRPGAVVLALGGGSWPRTGSTGSWQRLLKDHGIAVSPLQAANSGWESPWPEALLSDSEGLPLKNVSVRVGGHSASSAYGDLVITRYGLEGAPIYRLGPELRTSALPIVVTLDLKPDLTAETVATRLASVQRNYVREASRRLKLSPAATALLKHLPDIGPWTSPVDLARTVKACPILLTGPRPLAEAISSAGGVPWTELTSSMMLKKLPGVFVAGEMIDWDAPTGGYLLQACFTTGTHAGREAVEYIRLPAGTENDPALQ